MILGIDPGLGGALALYEPKPLNVIVVDMPVLQLKKKALDLYALARWFDIHAGLITRAIIEDPHAMPGQGVSSMFKFGHACGVVQAMTAAHFVPMRLVSPSHWKQRMQVTADKDSSRLRASQLFPAFSHLWFRSRDDGRAEAVLIAVFGAMPA